MLGGCLVFVITNFSHDICDVGWLLLCVVGKVDPHVKLCVVVYLFVLGPKIFIWKHFESFFFID